MSAYVSKQVKVRLVLNEIQLDSFTYLMATSISSNSIAQVNLHTTDQRQLIKIQ